jgi:hypothetical protein
MTAQAPPRLQVVNAFISLCQPHDGWPSTLHDLGYRLAGLEIPVRNERGGVTIDAVAAHQGRDALLAAECKSGSNVKEEQARHLADLDPAAVIRMASVTAVGGQASPMADAVFVCFKAHMQRILRGLNVASVAAPIIAVGETALEQYGARFADDAVQAAFAQPVQADGPPPSYLVLDEQSSPEEFDERVLAELVACTSRRLRFVTIRALTEQIVELFAVLGRAAQGALQRRVGESAQRVAASQPDSFAYRPRTEARSEPDVAILRTPEDNDPRGRTQAYQAISRRVADQRSRGRARPQAEGQLDFDRLLQELGAGEDSTGEDAE